MNKIYRYGFWLFSLLTIVELIAIASIQTTPPRDTISPLPNKLHPQGSPSALQPKTEYLPSEPTLETTHWSRRVEAYENLRKTKGISLNFVVFDNQAQELSSEVLALLDISPSDARDIHRQMRETKKRALQQLRQNTLVQTRENRQIQATYTPPKFIADKIEEDFWTNIHTTLGPERAQFLQDLERKRSQHPHPLHSFAARRKTWTLSLSDPRNLNLAIESTNPNGQPLRFSIFFSDLKSPGAAIETFLQLLPEEYQDQILATLANSDDDESN